MKKIMLILLLLALAGGGFFYYQARQHKKAAAVEAQKYTTAEVERRTMRLTVDSTGEVRPENRLEVKPPMAGRVEQLLVNEGESVRKGQIVAWMSSTERATLLDAARAKGPDALAYWEEIYKAAPLISPLDGTVIVRSIEPGQTIAANNAVIVIADRLILVGQVDETDIGSVRAGQKVTIRLDAYPDSVFEGTVKSIAYDSKVVSNVTMYEVKVAPGNLPGFARSGMTATLTFLMKERMDVPAVPTAALEYRRDKAFVLIPAAGGKEPESRPVKTGISENTFTEITEGLAEGDTVLIPQVTRKKETAANPFLPRRPSSSGQSRSQRSDTR